MPRPGRILFVGSLLFYPLVVHLFILQGSPAGALIVLLGVCLMLLLADFASSARHVTWWTGIYALLAAAGVASLLSERTDALYVPPLLFNLALAAVFGRSLEAGSVPLIEGVMRRHRRADMPPELVAYARQLTWLWTAFFLAMAAAALALALYASLEAWSLFANVINYALVAVLFLLQFAYGHWRFRHLHISPVWAVLRDLPGDLARSRAAGGRSE